MSTHANHATRSRDTLSTPKPAGDFWERFWFSPIEPRVLVPVRIGLAIAVILYCISWLGELTTWFSADGVFPVDRLGRLVMATGIESLAAWQFSLLYWVQSPTLLIGFVCALGAAAAAMGYGIGGRWTVAVVWIGCVSFANRAWLLVGPGEFALATSLACLWVGGLGRGTENDRPSGWSGLSRRLFQVHLALMILVVCGVQLIRGVTSANDGVAYEGVARMVSANPWLGPDYAGWFLGNPLGTFLGGALAVIPLICLPMLIFRLGSLRIAFFTLIACFALAGLLSGYWVLTTTWVAMLLAFLPQSKA